MKKIISVVLALALVFSLAGCMPSDKVYDSGIGLKVTLPGNFKEQTPPANTQVNYFLASPTTGFVVIKESFDAFEGFGDYTLEEYADLLLQVHAEKNPSEFKETDGFLSSEFTSTVGENEFTYQMTALKGSNAFWIIQFYTTSDSYEKAKPQFNKWLKTIEIE